jgi:hypothetical protein
MQYYKLPKLIEELGIDCCFICHEPLSETNATLVPLRPCGSLSLQAIFASSNQRLDVVSEAHFKTSIRAIKQSMTNPVVPKRLWKLRAASVPSAKSSTEPGRGG